MKTPPARRDTASSANLGELLVLAVILLPPLFFQEGKESFRLPKLMLAEWLGLASLLVLAFGLRTAGLPGPRRAWRGLPALRAVLPSLLVASLGLWTSAHPFHTREALADLWIGAACLVGWSVGLSASRQEGLLRATLWPAAILAAIGALQFHRLWQPLQFTGIEWDPRLGLTSLAGNPGDLAACLVLPSLIAARALPERSGAGRAATAVALGLCLYGIALTQTIAALAAVALGLAVYGWGVVPRRRALAALALGALLAAAVVLAVAPLRARVAGKLGALAAGDLNAVLTGRLDGWRAAVWMLSHHPVTGVGQGAYLPEFSPAKLALLDRGVKFLPGQTQPVFANAHNEILEVGAEWGVPGLLALAWGIWTLLATRLRRSRVDRMEGEDKEEEAEPDRDRALAWGGIAALALLSLAYFPFRVAIIAYPAILFLAWVLRPGSELGEEEEA
jgi:hypothetical protein